MMLLTLAILLGVNATASTTQSAEELANKMLQSIGGRAAWAKTVRLINRSQQNRVAEPHEVHATISMDFERHRFRIETTAPQLHLIRVIDSDNTWRLTREDQIETLPEALVAEDTAWYRGHVYRTLSRIARKDPALRLAVAKDDRLEVFDQEGRVAWFRLDGRGEPYAFGALSDDQGSLCGPWSFERDGIRHPLWVARADGTWRANILDLQVNPNLRDELFERPVQHASLTRLRGSWRGTGNFQGAPVAVDLEVGSTLADARQQLSIRIFDPKRTMQFFAGSAHYRRDLDGLNAVWLDSNGAQYQVRAQHQGSCLLAYWGATQALSGRSRYCLKEHQQLEVTDEFMVDAETWRSIGQYQLTKSK
jgi:hypothetical protein